MGDESEEYLMQQRAQELSVDRIGYLATESLDIAIKAMMKTVSGLKSKYLRFDISNYLSHLKEPSREIYRRSQLYTHPSFLFRCKALLWFSMKVRTMEDVHSINSREVFDLDEKVRTDLKKYIDGPTRQLIESRKKNVAMWTYMDSVIRDNTFDKKEQNIFIEIIWKNEINEDV